MVLNDKDITRMIYENKLIRNISREELLTRVNPNSIDLTIEGHVLRPKSNTVPIFYGKAYDKNAYWENDYNPDTIILKPGQSILACTNEYIVMPDSCYGQVFVKSSLGRLFINHMMAGVIDAGFEGTITMELKNEGPHTVIIEPGQRVVQLVLFKLTDYAEHPYWAKSTSRYNGQVAPTPSREEHKA